jgi:hypothetical protein
MSEIGGKCSANRPWESEPNEWSGSFHGLDGLALRSWTGSWNGYVRVPQTHPFFGLGYDVGVRAPDDWREHNDIEELGYANTFFMMLEEAGGDGPAPGYAPIKGLLGVHHGLTFAGELEGREGWYFGFDCAHAWDLQPGLLQHLEEIGAPDFVLEGQRSGVYRTLEYVIHNIEHLAQQLVDYVTVMAYAKNTEHSRA